MEPEREPSSPTQKPLWPLALLGILFASSVAFLGKKKSKFHKFGDAIHTDDQAHKKSNGPGNETPIVADVVPAPPCKYKTTECRPDQTPWWQTLGEGIALVGGLALLWVNYTQMQFTQQAVEAANAANKQTKTQWEAQHRPWVGNGEVTVEPPVFLVYPDSRTQISFTIEIPMKNVGVSPAFHVDTELMGNMTEQIAAPPTMNKMMESACRAADSNSKNVGGVLFPNNTGTPFRESANIMSPIAKINDVHRVWVTVCTAYSGTTDGKELHHTKIWVASWPINGQPTEIHRSTQPAAIYYSLPITKWGIVKIEAD